MAVKDKKARFNPFVLPSDFFKSDGDPVYPLVVVHRGHRWLLVVAIGPSQPPELRNQFLPGAPLEFVRGVQRWWWRAVSGEQTK